MSSTYSENVLRQKRCIMPDLVVGTKVWLQTSNLTTSRPNKSLDYKYLGPYEIIEQVNPVSFRLRLPPTLKIHNVFHAKFLEPYHESTIPGRIIPPPPPVTVVDGSGDSHIELEVESIVDKKFVRSRPYYRVHWHGYDVADSTWEPAEYLVNAPDKIADFERTSRPWSHIKRIKLNHPRRL